MDRLPHPENTLVLSWKWILAGVFVPFLSLYLINNIGWFQTSNVFVREVSGAIPVALMQLVAIVASSVTKSKGEDVFSRRYSEILISGLFVALVGAFLRAFIIIF